MHQPFKGRKIILAMPVDVDLYKNFEENLVCLGFEVVLINNIDVFRYKKIKHRLINFFRKFFLKDKSYKKELQKNYNKENQLAKLNSILIEFDYSLVIRADIFHESVIKLICQKSQNCYAYQWDGLNRYPDILPLIDFFKIFYVFDILDNKNIKNTTYITNFYFDCYPYLFDDKDIKFDVYFVGGYDDRINTIIETCEKLNSIGLKLNIIIRGSSLSKINKLKKYPYIKVVEKQISFKENLKNISESKIILDFHHPNIHSGLSFRTFEAIGYGKKLITTNALTKEYDFYNPTQFLILNDSMELEKFIDLKIEKTSEIIKIKYSFTNWISNILEKENCLKIEKP